MRQKPAARPRFPIYSADRPRQRPPEGLPGSYSSRNGCRYGALAEALVRISIGAGCRPMRRDNVRSASATIACSSGLTASVCATAAGLSPCLGELPIRTAQR